MFVTPAMAQEEHPATEEALPSDHGQPSVEGTVVPTQDHGTEGPFPPMNPEFFASQILWLAITFGIFYLVLKRVILPRIGGIIENRRDRIALDLEAAERMKTDADEAQAAYSQELAEARARSQKIAGDARDSARADAEAERARIEGDLDARLETAQARIGEIKTRTLADVGQIAEDVTQAVLSQVAGIQANQDEVSRAVQAVRA
ncbi:F0F1 ATP synthase subunit B [Antarcticirhabdus aurantiaca]|uniref:F0F1 ATP synthase subunit B n=1 Tax=Antarcticirhabdus aurantiaca TaxID=2606717 RepID=A0ACD4NTT3_9HYPH|nr:F0F1 ATP synthase subunit B [Antarcticirhabdus aurantiaca]WAJ30270.1 F0F1 ATP synthase subunit B [Jeongeuplla avenae]